VVPRGDAIDVLYRRTEWFRVRTQRGVEGWAHQRDMVKTSWPTAVPFLWIGRSCRLHRAQWELGVLGIYSGAADLHACRVPSTNSGVEFTARSSSACLQRLHPDLG
jgi:hypothetical protein